MNNLIGCIFLLNYWHDYVAWVSANACQCQLNLWRNTHHSRQRPGPGGVLAAYDVTGLDAPIHPFDWDDPKVPRCSEQRCESPKSTFQEHPLRLHGENWAYAPVPFDSFMLGLIAASSSHWAVDPGSRCVRLFSPCLELVMCTDPKENAASWTKKHKQGGSEAGRTPMVNPAKSTIEQEWLQHKITQQPRWSRIACSGELWTLGS